MKLRYSAFVGLDVHKETIAVAVADTKSVEVRYLGTISNSERSIQRLVGRLDTDGEDPLLFCYEAGPCGYDLYRQLLRSGHDCMLVAPGLIPRSPSDRIKNDRRDACRLARLLRAGELTSVWVPDTEHEAIRDLVRAREDTKAMERQARQRLLSFLLRRERRYGEGKSNWTQKHMRWLEEQRFAHPAQQMVFQEYVDVVKDMARRIISMNKQIDAVLKTWSLRPLVEALMSLRGVSQLTAVTLVAELGDINRFDNPRQLMSFLGLVPSEHSSGPRRRQGGITKTGNSHARRVLVEAAWSYRLPPRKTAHMRRKGALASSAVQEIAWSAQKRLCGRFDYLAEHRKKPRCKAVTAVARELVGFIWAVAKEVDGLPHGSRITG